MSLVTHGHMTLPAVIHSRTPAHPNTYFFTGYFFTGYFFAGYFFTGQQQEGISLPVIGQVIMPAALADCSAVRGAGAGTCMAWLITGAHDKAISTGRVEIIAVLLLPSVSSCPSRGRLRVMVCFSCAVRLGEGIRRVEALQDRARTRRPAAGTGTGKSG